MLLRSYSASLVTLLIVFQEIPEYWSLSLKAGGQSKPLAKGIKNTLSAFFQSQHWSKSELLLPLWKLSNVILKNSGNYEFDLQATQESYYNSSKLIRPLKMCGIKQIGVQHFQVVQ